MLMLMFETESLDILAENSDAAQWRFDENDKHFRYIKYD